MSCSALTLRCVGALEVRLRCIQQCVCGWTVNKCTYACSIDISEWQRCQILFLGRNQVTHRYHATIVLLLATCVGLRQKGKSSNYFRRTILHRSSSE